MIIPPFIQAKVLKWLELPLSEASRKELLYVREHNPQELLHAFSSDLSFGTSGMRRLMGEGPNRINFFTIAKVTQGVSQCLYRNYRQNRGFGKETPLKTDSVCSFGIHPGKTVVICYDSRENSLFFAETAARVFAANKIAVLLVKEMRPSPWLSFVMRHTKSNLGIMITASHNPKEYNGYEIYQQEGGELSVSLEQEIGKEIDKVDLFSPIPLAKIDDPLITKIDPSDWDDAYLKAVFSLQYAKKNNQEHGFSLKIVYSSLHGTGCTLAPRALASWGFTSVGLVDEQIKPDGKFPTIREPNPEHPDVFTLGLKKMQETDSDLLIVNDCDADRIGVALKGGQILTGNEFAAIIADYLSKKAPPPGAFIVTYVTTPLVKAIAKASGIACFEVFTGFKFIAEKMKHLQEHPFLLGVEESYGCLLGTYARNKDGIAAACLISEIALEAKQRNLTLGDLLHAIYRKYGIYRDIQQSLVFTEGDEAREKCIHHLRKNPPQEIAGIQVIEMKDYFPEENMLIFHLQEESSIIVRPSGTEPKLRIHVTTRVKEFGTIEEGIAKGDQYLQALYKVFTAGFSVN